MAHSRGFDAAPGSGGGGSGVTDFNGRTGAVSPAQADYDAFFLTAAEGDLAYQPLDADLTAIAALSGTGAWAKRTAVNTWALTTPTAADVGADATGTAAGLVATLQDMSLFLSF